jgi:hypothetical protein
MTGEPSSEIEVTRCDERVFESGGQPDPNPRSHALCAREPVRPAAGRYGTTTTTSFDAPLDPNAFLARTRT